MSAGKLYTPAMLAAAVELADWPPVDDADFHGTARSKTCGSTLAVDVSLTARGEIEAIGMRVTACAVGQAAAAIFARHAKGLTHNDLLRAREAMALWLAGKSGTPSWPDIELIAPAREFPARHGAILLPWNAALAALSSAPASS